jgi:uncharacterized protein YjbJ (UPF0337 family)
VPAAQVKSGRRGLGPLVESGTRQFFSNPIRRGIVMNKDQVKGRAEQAKGTMKEAAGKAVGHRDLEAEGKVDKAAGKVQSTYGDAKEKAKDAAKRH